MGEAAALARHYLRSTLRAAAVVLPGGLRERAADALGGLGPTAGSLGNDWTARPSAEHPRPVVLLHGTNDTSAAFVDLAVALRTRGYAVFTPDYGRETASLRGRAGGAGTADIRRSAGEIAGFIDNVLSLTGADQVDLVGHSQGGLHAHAYVRGAGSLEGPGYAGAARVGRVVTLGSTFHGASPLGALDTLAHRRLVAAALDASLGPSARQQVRGSDVLAWLAAEPDAAPGVAYTAVATRYDHTVRPASAQRLTPGPTVTNLWLQDVDPASTTEHADLPRDPVVIDLVLRALDD